ncbi:MAG: carboxypeptidase-like regulatory domain-containing protein [Planctomycetota bacterium]
MFRSFRLCMATILMAPLTVGPVVAEEAVEVRSRDVLLHSGSLSGVVLNRESHPLPGITVQFLHGKNVIAVATSDDNGNFAVHGLRNGGHVVATGEEKELVRFWNSTAAPPSASARLILVVDEEVVRGQGYVEECGVECGDESVTRKSCLCRALSNPTALLLLGGGAAGIVAIVAHNDDDAPASP